MSRSNTGVFLLVTIVPAFYGCAPQKEQVGQAEQRSLQVNEAALPGYLGASLKACGTIERWSETGLIQAECVVSYYNPQGGRYITEQRHEIYPVEERIYISEQTPEGKEVWEISGGNFAGPLHPQKDIESVSLRPYEEPTARVILTLMSAPIVLTKNAETVGKAQEPAIMNGRRYYPADLGKSGGRFSRKLYINCDNLKIDLVWVGDAAKRIFVAGRGYDYRWIEQTGICIPKTIEIFKADSDGRLQDRAAEIKYHKVKAVRK